MVQVCVWLIEEFTYVASIFGGVGDGKKEMLRKKYHVVRKKTHVVRKFFYVASIFGGVARRRTGRRGNFLPRRGNFLPRRGIFLPRHPVGGNAFNAFTEHPSFLGALIQVYRTPIKFFKPV